MKSKKKKKKIQWQQYTLFIFFGIAGGFCGIFTSQYMDAILDNGGSAWECILGMTGAILTCALAIYGQVIIHEAGHLICGLLSGYQFNSFRIMSFMWVKQDGRICFKRYSLAGTGGQCLMSPPDLVDGRMPVILYNLGGILINIVTGLVSLLLYFVLPEIPILSMLLICFGIMGLAYALANGIPLRLTAVDNDGYNALSLHRNPEACRAFWIQMKIAEQTAAGVRVKDMPEEWFEVPPQELMGNHLISSVGVFACNRLMDQHRFAEADALMAQILEQEDGLVGIYRNFLLFDRIYCNFMSEEPKELTEEMYGKEQKKMLKALKNFPSAIRTEYVYALFVEGQEVQAEIVQEQFEKCGASYPYPQDVESERELMEIAKTRYEEQMLNLTDSSI